MGNDTLGSIVLAQIGAIIDAPLLTAWQVICKNDNEWTTIPTNFQPTTQCKDY